MKTRTTKRNTLIGDHSRIHYGQENSEHKRDKGKKGNNDSYTVETGDDSYTVGTSDNKGTHWTS